MTTQMGQLQYTRMFMKKVMLGVSLYPEQETLEEIDAY